MCISLTRVTGARPAFGNPDFASLTIGGDDIDFPGIIFNCILDYNFYGLGGKKRSCDDQRAHTWSLLNAPALVDNIATTIQKVVAKGRTGAVGDAFKLYVTGYADFFNDQDPGCDTVTFARTANPKDDGKTHPMMTTALRGEFNAMSDALNKAISAAVSRNSQQGVSFVDIQTTADGKDALAGRRFCEKGVQEPDQSNTNLWFYHYPYNVDDSTGNPDVEAISAAYDQTTQGVTDFDTKWPQEYDLWDAVLGTLGESANSADDPDVDGTGFWGDTVGSRAKVFHPQTGYHSFIRDQVLAAYNAAPPSSDTCAMKYKVVEDGFTIYGSFFDEDKLGSYGANLLTNLRHCGAVTSWTFTFTPDDPTWQWTASGNLPLVGVSCLTGELQAAGGVDSVQCSSS